MLRSHGRRRFRSPRRRFSWLISPRYTPLSVPITELGSRLRFHTRTIDGNFAAVSELVLVQRLVLGLSPIPMQLLL
jgi:hypothetical protein